MRACGENFQSSKRTTTSGYPVDGLRVSFDRMFLDFKGMTAALSASDRRKLFHDNAAKFYQL